MFRKIVATALAGTMLVACATSPGKISASYVSPMMYSELDCRQLRMEMIRVEAAVSAVTGAQQTKSNNDKMAMGVGLVLFWPALFFLANGEDQRAELASLKGKYEAIEQVTMQKRCGMGGGAPQVQTAATGATVAASATASTSAPRAPNQPVTCSHYAIKVLTDPSQNRCAN